MLWALKFSQTNVKLTTKDFTIIIIILHVFDCYTMLQTCCFVFFLRSFSRVYNSPVVFWSLSVALPCKYWFVVSCCRLFPPVSSVFSSFIRKQVFQNAQKQAPGMKPMTLVISKLLLFIFLVIFSLRPRGTDVMSDFASSKKNFIRVVLIWNSCCLNSLGFIYCLSSSSWQLHWPLTFSSKF